MTTIPIKHPMGSVENDTPVALMRIKSGQLQQIWIVSDANGRQMTWRDVPTVADDAPDVGIGKPWE